MVRIGHSVIYFYMVRIGHSVFYFYMVRNGHNVSTSVILKSARDCPGIGNNACRIGILLKSNLCRNYNGI